MAKIKYRFNTKTLTYEKVTIDYNWRKITLRLIIFLAITYFIIGYILVLMHLFDQNNYLTISGIVGGIASVAGLLTFISSRINKDDVERIGVEYFKQVAEAADKLHEKEKILQDREKQLSTKERELKELELKKAELEFAVQKASMTIFLKDQLGRVENSIVEIIEGHKDLSNNIVQRESIIKQLKDLEEEIKSTDKTKIVEEVIAMVTKEKKKEDSVEHMSFLDILLKAFLLK